jgi:hypothetical protein
MTRGEAINDRARKGAAFVQAEQAFDRTSVTDVKARYLAGIALANARYAFEAARRLEKSISWAVRS